MGPGLGQKIGKARDPRPLPNDIQKIAMFTRGSVGVMWNST